MSFEKELFRLDHPHGNGELYCSWQKGSGIYLATVGSDSSVGIYNRQGKIHEKIRLPGQCTGFGWDADGDLLGMICDGSFSVLLWDSNTGKKFPIDSGLRDNLTVIAWARKAPIVAVASARGHLSIYNHITSKRIPVLGKHNKRVVTAAWGVDNTLALGSDDKTITINNSQGDTLKTIQIHGSPSALQFSGEHGLDGANNTLSLIVGKKVLYIYNLQDPDEPMKLAFEPLYGDIVSYEWFGEGQILVGFSAGYLIAISTKIRELGQELFQIKNHHVRLCHLSVCHQANYVATCGDNNVKVHNLNNLSEVKAVMSLSQETSRVEWSQDGQLMCVATNGGLAVVYLATVVSLHAVCSNTVALLTSLNHVQVYFVEEKVINAVELWTEVEPSLIAVGPYHLIVGMNNRTWTYDIGRNGQAVLLSDRQYISGPIGIAVNTEYTSVLLNSVQQSLCLHLTESGVVGGDDGNLSARTRDDREMKVFPDEGEQMSITCHALTTDFLVYASDLGDVRLFSLEDWTNLTEYKHTVSIKQIFPDAAATRIVVIDDKTDGYLYSPVQNTMLLIPEFPSTIVGVLWDISPDDRNVFIAFDTKVLITFIHLRDSIDGARVSKIGETKLPIDQTPLVLRRGVVTLKTPGGKLVSLNTDSESPGNSAAPQSLFGEAIVRPARNTADIFARQIALTRYTEAWNSCLLLNSNDNWIHLANSALKNLDIEMGIKVYRHLGDVGMVSSLERLQYVENKKLLSGHIAEILGDFDRAQILYLESSEPINALIMRQNLLQWDQAIELARSLAPERVPYTSLEHATQLELIGQYAEALVHYERAYIRKPALVDTDEDSLIEHNARCTAGVARTSLRVGDFRRGITIASSDEVDNTLRVQCADILVSVKKLGEAAALYEKADQFDKAAAAYIGLKNWKKVGQLLPSVSDSRIYKQYAKARESAGDYESAAEAYQKAGETEAFVRLLIDKLNQPQRAVAVVQETRNIEAARTVAKFFEKLGDYATALKFLVISRSENEALRLCKEHDLVELYAELVTTEMVGLEEGERLLTMLAAHLEQQGSLLAAAHCYYHTAQFNKALRNLLQVAKGNPENEEAITLAIEVVGAANDDAMANQLIELLLGDVDGEPRDPKYVFKLYRARKQYREAAKTAIIIANDEMIGGNYSVAHSVLLGMCMDLHDNGLPIIIELMSLLTLLHSYRLVRLHVKLGNHYIAARMLLRVSDNVSKFPAHIVPILTSTVIECHRADLKGAAFNYAAMLMKPEYKSKIEDKYVKKLEGVVRRPPKGPDNKIVVDPPEEMSPCPYCDFSLADSQLTCPQCSNNIPFCIATGRHVVKDDFTVCPNCQFPAIKSELIKILETCERCPMCSEKISPEDLRNDVYFDEIFLQSDD
ncbi:hypothetical protein O3M35_006365 [Rhynocoris fuscipes]|uniref:WDR19 protein n=1 Tax=Rhynocoris fuscipes TaxID=488301 RepID=A0AAW1DD89_9HEMI